MDPVTMLLVAGTVLGAGSAISQGNAQDKAARFEARQLEREAKRAFAQGTREQSEINRQGRVLESNTRAQMAGSGGVTDDAGATGTIGEGNAVMEYNALAAMYQAKSVAQGRRFQAKARRYEGKTSKAAGRTKALSTVISGRSDYYKMKNG